MALIPADRLTDWTPGTATGVIGGIPTNRTNLINVTQAPYNADNTGASDTKTAIQAAIDAAVAGDVVYLPTGTYRLNSGLSVGLAQSGITIRGDGPTLTTIDFRGSNENAVQFGTGYSWNWPSAVGETITGGMTEGSTTITMADTSAFSSGGALMRIGVDNQSDNTAIEGGAVPTFSVVGFDRITTNAIVTQIVKIVSKTSGSVTFFPGIIRPPDSGLTASANNGQWTNDGYGIEDLCIDGTNGSMTSAVLFQQCSGSWALNVKSINTAKYFIKFAYSVNCEARHCDLRVRTGGGPGGGGFLLSDSCSCLFEDNIVYSIFPNVEMNDGSVGNAFLYNCFEQSAADIGNGYFAIDSNHGPHNAKNLFEGNIVTNIVSDGYFGSEESPTYLRNWIPGAPITNDAIENYTHSWKRFTRKGSLCGNILGKTGVNIGSFIYGQPNIGGDGSTGTCQPTLGDFWDDWKATATLTVRASATAGTITLNAPAYFATSDPSISGYDINLRWGGSTNTQYFHATPTTSTTMSWTGGSGTDLPAQGSTVNVWMWNNGYQELDLDVEASTIEKGNYTYGPDGAPGSMSSLGGDTLYESLAYAAEPDWWQDENPGLPWPPFDPTTPNAASYANTPAGIRFSGESPASGDVNFSGPGSTTFGGSGTVTFA